MRYKILIVTLLGLLFASTSQAQSDTLFLTVDRLFEWGLQQSLQLQADALHETVAQERAKDARAQQ